MSHKLEEIRQTDWAPLRDLYLTDWPSNMLGYYTIRNYIDWIEKLPTIKNLSIYSLNGEWSDGTFVVIDGNQVILNTLNETNERLTALLSLIDWSAVFIVSTMRQKHRPALLRVLESKNLAPFFDKETILYYKPKEECAEFNVSIPSGISVGKLTPIQVEYANSVWPHRSSNSLASMQRLSELNSNVALTTDAGRLVSWCFRLPSGPLGALQVDDDFRRKGFGAITLKLMAIQLSQIGHDTFGCVVRENLASLELFAKLGFAVVDNIHFVGIHDL